VIQNKLPIEDQMISEGLQVESLHDQQIRLYTFHDTRRDTWEAWYAFAAKIVDSEPDATHRYMQDFSNRQTAFTPATRGLAVAFSKKYGHISGYGAIVLQGTAFSRISRFFIEREVRKLYRNQEIRIFYNREEALAWLESTLET
jgi:hypothetical protein